ncbi:hypothetical protein [Novosphingobium colocasiae]|nr:hypothetical protein [Novosphingobium colocasiae]
MFGRDERRMQVRAYNFWAGLLDDRSFPDIARLRPEELPDFGPFGILLDFTDGIENPGIAFLGEEIARECEVQGPIRTLADVPSRSLLSRITDHYMQILANAAPIGFEAEFVNQRNATILYRGILMPFSSDDQTIDHIFGVINWKEMSAPAVGALELSEADVIPQDQPLHPREEAPMAEWADGPVSLGGSSGGYGADHPFPQPEFGVPGGLTIDDYPIEFAAGAALAPEDMGLGDWLAEARDLASQALRSEDRSRAALYAAVSRAWDFALVALAYPEDFAELAEDAGVTLNERAPLTPVVKLVFGADYDKTRLAEFAAVLAHAQRLGLGTGALEALLAETPGGLKAVVRAERRLRRLDKGETGDAPHDRVLTRLRALEPRPLADLGRQGEFSLLVARRLDDGTLVMLGEVADDAGLLDKAARHLID